MVEFEIGLGIFSVRCSNASMPAAPASGPVSWASYISNAFAAYSGSVVVGIETE